MKKILQKSEICRYINSDDGFLIFNAQEIFNDFKDTLHEELEIKFSKFDSSFDELVNYIAINNFEDIKL